MSPLYCYSRRAFSANGNNAGRKERWRYFAQAVLLLVYLGVMASKVRLKRVVGKWRRAGKIKMC